MVPHVIAPLLPGSKGGKRHVTGHRWEEPVYSPPIPKKLKSEAGLRWATPNRSRAPVTGASVVKLVETKPFQPAQGTRATESLPRYLSQSSRVSTGVRLYLLSLSCNERTIDAKREG